MVEGAVAEGAKAVMLGVVRSVWQSQQGQKGLLQNVFGFAVAQAEGAAIKDQAGRFGLVKGLAPQAVDVRFVHAIRAFAKASAAAPAKISGQSSSSALPGR
jgi:hypothetical protein